MEHTRRAAIIALVFPIPGSTISPGALGWYWWTQNRSAVVQPGDYCRLDWYDPKQPHLF